MRFSERLQPIPLIEAKDYGSVGIDSAAVNLGLLHGLAAVFMFGTLTGNSTLKVYTGATAAKTTPLAFEYRLGAADFKTPLADQLGEEIAVASTGLTLSALTFDHRMLTIEIDSQAIPEGQPWLTFEIDATATVMNVAAVGISWTRYSL
jgi:hypothetical protein